MLSTVRRFQCRRLNDFELRKWLRQLSVPRRVSLTAVLILFSLYFVISYLTSAPHVAESKKCLNECLNVWKTFESDNFIAVSNKKSGFIGNGFIGVSGDGELRLKTSRVLSVRSAFYPIIGAKIQDSGSFAETYITDYRDGTMITLRCYHIKDECVCTMQRAYAHRRRPHLLIQEFQMTNPLSNNVEIKLSMKIPKYWTQKKRATSVWKLDKSRQIPEHYDKYQEGIPSQCMICFSSSLAGPVYTRDFESDRARTVAAATCSKIPETIIVEQKQEISLRFLCVINYVSPLPVGKNEDPELRSLDESVVKEFADYSSLDGTLLYREHLTAWQKLNTITFGISKSLAPSALNANEINATRYMLLSNMRDPLLEIGVSAEQKEAAAASMNIIDMCYTGHSTLLVPSRLWKKSDNFNEVIETMDVWLLTLEKRGCSGLLKAGASGLAQAFVLSLLASKFSHEHLEVDIDPADLLREITVKNLTYSPNTRISISIRLDSDNRPYFMISSDSEVFACDAACLNHPLAIGRSNVHIPIKITKPSTPILYISRNKNHLEQLRGTIHVVEVMDAPAHELELIALHKHGHSSGGLPLMFWLVLGALMTLFHLFLFKLLYSEWKKGDKIPYNNYLRQHYLRHH